MFTVAVLMSTYNGERFLKEQIDSILGQAGVAVELFVRDDGSKDKTKEILTEYAQNYSNVHVDFAQNVGVGSSFMSLLYNAPDNFDFYAFADQDDIWVENKMLEGIEKLNESGKVLYGSNQECVDKDGNSLGLRYSADTNIHITPVSILSENKIAGCTMIMNSALKSLLTCEEHRPTAELLKNRIHDVWVAEIASIAGGIYYDERSFIKYRQHENNVVGAYKEGFFKRIKTKLKKLRNPQKRNGRSKLAVEACEKFPSFAKEYPLLLLCAKARKFSGKIKLIGHGKELRKYTGESGIGLFFKILFGWF